WRAFAVVALAILIVAVFASIHFSGGDPKTSAEPPAPQPIASPQPPAPSAGQPAPQPPTPPVSRASPPAPQTERVELTSLGLTMNPPKGFEPRVSGSGVVLSPPRQLRLQTTLIAVHPAGVVEDPSVYSQETHLANGATLRYRAVARPEAQPPAIELQGLMEAFGTSYFVSCRDASADRAPAAEWCLPF